MSGKQLQPRRKDSQPDRGTTMVIRGRLCSLGPIEQKAEGRLGPEFAAHPGIERQRGNSQVQHEAIVHQHRRRIERDLVLPGMAFFPAQEWQAPIEALHFRKTGSLSHQLPRQVCVNAIEKIPVRCTRLSDGVPQPLYVEAFENILEAQTGPESDLFR